MRGASFLLLIAACGDDTKTMSDAGGKDVSAQDVIDASTVDAFVVDVVDSAADAPVDTATEAEASADASVSGYVLWLDAAKGVTTNGSLVTKWADQSGHTNDAVAGFYPPTLVASAINGLPVVRFNASGTTRLVALDSASLEWGTGDYLVAVVARFDNDPTWASSGVGAFYLKLNGSGTAVSFLANRFDLQTLARSTGLQLDEDTTNNLLSTTAYNDGVARLYIARRAGTTLELRVNGGSVASVTQVGTVDVSNAGADVGIGSYATNAGENLDGDIAEMIAIAGPITSGDLTTLESNLVSKYGL